MDDEVDISEGMWSYIDNADFMEEDSEGIDARTRQLKEQVERLEVSRDRSSSSLPQLIES